MRVKDVSRSEEPPDDRRHRLAAAMLKAFEEHPESDGAKAIAFVTIEEGSQSLATTALCGYEEDSDAATDLLAHLAAMFEANGIRIDVIPNPRPIGEG